MGWTVNTADTGLIVNGDNVMAYGLFVEHYQKYEVIWNGNDGADDLLPERDALRPAGPGRLDERRHERLRRLQGGGQRDQLQGYGMGSYCFFNVNPSVNAYHAFEAPNRPRGAVPRPVDHLPRPPAR